MEAIDFTLNYLKYVQEIEVVVKDEYQSVFTEMKQINPQDLVRPESNVDNPRGYIWSIILSIINLVN